MIHFEIEQLIPATAEEVYKAWLDSKAHSQMTGGEAICSDAEGEAFSAWDEYIHGVNKKLIQGQEIVQSWRTVEFDEQDEDSELVIRLKDVDGQCLLTLIHRNIPNGQPDYEQGWIDNYFEPMLVYFGKRR